MVTIAQLRKLAFSFPEVTEAPHFEKTSFRVKKKIFVTFDPTAKRASLKLSAIDQDVFSKAGKESIYPVPNKWGIQGWTLVEMSKIDKTLFTDIVTAAYCEVAPAKLGQQVKQNDED